MNMEIALKNAGCDPLTVRAFLKYHTNLPQIWRKFEEKALNLIACGIKRFGAKCIMENIRYEESIETKDEFKICNSFTAYYARAFEIKYPAHKGFFETRSLTGLSEASRKAA